MTGRYHHPLAAREGEAGRTAPPGQPPPAVATGAPPTPTTPAGWAPAPPPSRPRSLRDGRARRERMPVAGKTWRCGRRRCPPWEGGGPQQERDGGGGG
ncbi:hypothetical protein I4F81_002336 [Pyropia yezoensis]|uniref:Uncharacterized protein n=1 Tax=Pyropia yezoensis TaxID=2788 RepID=A0ACC3BPC3_PYRYE|nr:hypothetical protein I4F81_002336 [Neopyropia yezoensis]